MDTNAVKDAKREKQSAVIASVLSIITGLLFGFYLMLLLDKHDAVLGMGFLFSGVFSNGLNGLAQILFYATPIIMTGLGVGFGFKCGVFNIGASGQFTIGSIVAIMIGVKWNFLPPVLHCLVAIIFAAVAGGIWGMIPGLLKAKCNVNEVISTILMNYIGLYLTNFLVQHVVYNFQYSQSMQVCKNAEMLSMNIGSAKFSIGFLFAVLFAVLVYFILEKTTFGYELKVCGKNRFASQYSGMKENKLIVSAMTISGILCGLGGAFMYLSGQGIYLKVTDVVASQGFSGLSVALVGMSSPIGIVLVALFLGYISVGGNMLQLLSFSPEVVNMIIATIVYCGALTSLFLKLIRYVIDKFSKKSEPQVTK